METAVANENQTEKANAEAAKAQLDRFKQTARELGCDETGEAFERAFAKAVPTKKPAKKPTP